MTKREKSMVASYEFACKKGYTSVTQAYRNPSAAKISAEKNILATKAAEKGYGYYVCGHNSNFFSCAYKYKDGNDEYLAYYTYAARYDIKLN